MQWILNFLTSSIGKKFVMSFTGLFLISFLTIHLIGNLQLLYDDDGAAFNKYAYFMTHNPLIKAVSFGLYAGIILHAWLGLALFFKNRKSKGQKYAVSTSANASFAAKQMAILGTLILAFLFIHMGDFWYKMKFTDQLAMVDYDGMMVKDLYAQVSTTFSKPLFAGIYIVGMIALAFHLWHGFQSAFQSLGLNHKKYTPIIQGFGKIFSIIVPAAFALIPIFMYLNR